MSIEDGRHPRYTECVRCGQPGEFFDSPTGTWWSHFAHPADGHDFEPMGWQAPRYECSQEPHPGVEFYGGGGCGECGYKPLADADTEVNADYREVFGRNPEPWRAPLGALRMTLNDESEPPWTLERARDECEELVRVLNGVAK